MAQPAKSSTTSRSRAAPIRVVLAKIGLDGHDRGIQVVARALRDAGMEVIYTGLWQSADAVARAVDEEDAEVLGVSILSGAHLTQVPLLLDALQARGVQDVLVLVGGIIPADDAAALRQLGVAGVFTPGTSMQEIVQFVEGGVRGV